MPSIWMILHVRLVILKMRNDETEHLASILQTKYCCILSDWRVSPMISKKCKYRAVLAKENGNMMLNMVENGHVWLLSFSQSRPLDGELSFDRHQRAAIEPRGIRNGVQYGDDVIWVAFLDTGSRI